MTPTHGRTEPRKIKAVVRTAYSDEGLEKIFEFDANVTDDEIYEQIQAWAIQSQIHKIGRLDYYMWVRRKQESIEEATP